MDGYLLVEMGEDGITDFIASVARISFLTLSIQNNYTILLIRRRTE
jgi:hypothetical protein